MRVSQLRLPLRRPTRAVPTPLTKEQQIANVLDLMDIHQRAYGNTTDGGPKRLPAILEWDREELLALRRSR